MTINVLKTKLIGLICPEELHSEGYTTQSRGLIIQFSERVLLHSSRLLMRMSRESPAAPADHSPGKCVGMSGHPLRPAVPGDGASYQPLAATSAVLD